MATCSDTLFDWMLYGAMVRSKRMKAGCKTAEAFKQMIYRRTRVNIGLDTLYKVEQGKISPDATYFMAINMALSGSPFPDWVANNCIGIDWDYVTAPTGSLKVPVLWAVDNWERECAGMPPNEKLQDDRGYYYEPSGAEMCQDSGDYDPEVVAALRELHAPKDE